MTMQPLDSVGVLDVNTEPSAQSVDTADLLEHYQSELGQVIEKNKELQRLHEVQESELVSKDREIESLQSSLSALKAENGALRRDLETEKETVSELQSSVELHISQITQLTEAKSLSQKHTEDVPDTTTNRTDFSEIDRFKDEIQALRVDLANTHLILNNSNATHASEVQSLQSELAEARVHIQSLIAEIAELELSLSQKDGADKSDSTIADGSHRFKEGLDYSELNAASTLAEEIMAFSVKPQSEDLEKENKVLRDSNVAMAGYIERIVQKLLDNSALEHILEVNGDAKISSSTGAMSPASSSNSEPRGQRKKLIGIGINMPTATLSIPGTDRTYLTPSENDLSPAESGFSAGLLSPKLRNSDGTSPSIGGYRRASSGGQKTLLPLKLAGSATSPALQSAEMRAPDSPVQTFSPASPPPSEGTTLAPKKSTKRRSWLGF